MDGPFQIKVLSLAMIWLMVLSAGTIVRAASPEPQGSLASSADKATPCSVPSPPPLIVLDVAGKAHLYQLRQQWPLAAGYHVCLLSRPGKDAIRQEPAPLVGALPEGSTADCTSGSAASGTASTVPRKAGYGNRLRIRQKWHLPMGYCLCLAEPWNHQGASGSGLTWKVIKPTVVPVHRLAPPAPLRTWPPAHHVIPATTDVALLARPQERLPLPTLPLRSESLPAPATAAHDTRQPQQKKHPQSLPPVDLLQPEHMPPGSLLVPDPAPRLKPVKCEEIATDSAPSTTATIPPISSPQNEESFVPPPRASHQVRWTWLAQLTPRQLAAMLLLIGGCISAWCVWRGGSGYSAVSETVTRSAISSSARARATSPSRRNARARTW